MQEQFLSTFYMLPLHLQREVMDFTNFLVVQYQKQSTPISSENPRKSNFGSAAGLIEMASDFDDPVEGFEAYMP